MQILVTVVLSIGSLKVTIIFAFNPTLGVPFKGDVTVISGGVASSVVNVHGFGMPLGLRLLPAKSFPPVIWNVYVVSLSNSLWDYVTV